MSTVENKALVQRYLAALSGKEKPASLVAQFVADPSLQQQISDVEAAFPCYELIAEEMLAEGDQVAMRFALRGVHQGEFMGIPPTGRQVAAPGMAIYRIAEGKIAGHWLQIDVLALVQQLGMSP